MEPICISLAERFGQRYRIGWEADGATKGLWPREEWPWLMEIVCRYGRVAPYGGEILIATTTHRRIGAVLRGLPGLLHAKGEDEVVVRFHVDHLDAVLAVIKPYRRRRVTAVERKRLAQIGATFRFGQMHGVEREQTAPRINERQVSGTGVPVSCENAK